MDVWIDYRETKRIKQSSKFFEKKGHNVIIKELLYGDFICGDCCIEYKTTKDFINSVQDKRVFRQAINMRNHFKHSFVVIEAEHKKIDRAIRDSLFHKGGTFSWNQFYGAVASLSTYSNVLIVPNFTEGLKLMNYLFEKCNDDKIRTFVKPVTSEEQWLVNFLCCEKGKNLGIKKAKLIVDELGLETLYDLFSITKEDLLSIKGVGEATADSIMERIR